MAEKKFGVRDLEIIDPTGTPTIESSGDLIVNAGGATERLRVTSSGEVGIGTDNPLNLLDILQDTGRTRLNQYGHIISQNHNHSTTNYWTIAPRDSGELDIAYGTPNGSGNIVDNTGDKVTILSSGGITFNGDTAQDNALDDYEEGTLDWRLQRTGSIGSGSNTDTVVRYTKIGNRVYVSGYIYTQNTSNSTGVTVELRDNSNVSNVATLPYVPNHHGGFPITGTRTIDDNYRNMAVTFRSGQSQVYIYKDDGDNDYIKNKNNVQINSAQTHLVIQFCGSYTTAS